jgi:hypothetical protein
MKKVGGHLRGILCHFFLSSDPKSSVAHIKHPLHGERVSTHTTPHLREREREEGETKCPTVKEHAPATHSAVRCVQSKLGTVFNRTLYAAHNCSNVKGAIYQLCRPIDTVLNRGLCTTITVKCVRTVQSRYSTQQGVVDSSSPECSTVGPQQRLHSASRRICAD